jgi:hypothetical protein
MSFGDDIIPISSRRPRLRAPVPAPASPPSAAEPRRIPILAVVVGAALAAMIAGMAIGQWRGVDRIRSLPDGVRAAAYARALGDIEQTCAPPPENDPLRQHCREQAQYVTIFPECDATCRQLVEPLLPHARR